MKILRKYPKQWHKVQLDLWTFQRGINLLGLKIMKQGFQMEMRHLPGWRAAMLVRKVILILQVGPRKIKMNQAISPTTGSGNRPSKFNSKRSSLRSKFEGKRNRRKNRRELQRNVKSKKKRKTIELDRFCSWPRRKSCHFKENSLINKRKKENKGRNKRRRKKSEERRKEKDRKRAGR